MGLLKTIFGKLKGIYKLGPFFGDQKWFESILAPNGKIYNIPHTASRVLIINPITDTTELIGNLDGGSIKYVGGSITNSGIIYCVPYNSSNILKIDTNTNNLSTFGNLSQGGLKWASSALADNGKIYCAPVNANNILVINTTNDSTYNINISTTGSLKYLGAIKAPNGKIYFIPSSSPNIMILNPNDDSVSYITGFTTNSLKWGSGVLANDGLIYCIPRNDSRILVIDTNNDTYSFLTETFTGSSKWIYGTMDSNGKIYACPLTETSLLVIDTIQKKAYKDYSVKVGKEKWAGSKFANNKIYLTPFYYNDVLVIPLSGNNVSKNVMLIGDSTIASFSCRSTSLAQNMFTSSEISDGWNATSIAAPGNTINQQLTAWNNHSLKTKYDYIIIQIGLNDMNTNISTTLSNYQNLINQVNLTKKQSAIVFISCMLPCKQRFIDLGLVNGQSNWVALNNAIMTSITGVNKRNNYHVPLLDDGNGNLKAIYDCGDHIHENQAGADIIITGFRSLLGLLPK